MPHIRTLIQDTVLASGIVLAAFALMLGLDPWLGMTQTPFLLFFGAVPLAALYLGRRGGIFATVLSSSLAHYFFIPPTYSLSTNLVGISRVLIFLLEGTLISVLIGSLRLAQRQTKESLRQLKSSESKFRRLVDSNIIGVASCDIYGAVTDANDVLLKNLGYSREDLLAGRVRWDAMTPADLKYRDVPAYEELITKGKNTPYEKVFMSKQGKRVPVVFGAALLEDDPEQIISFILDISDRKQAEEDLRESERRFRRLVESNMFGVAFGNFAGEIHYANDYFLKMVGYSRPELESGHVQWTEITPAEFLPLDERAMAELRSIGVAVPFEKEYLRKDKSRVPILIGSALLQEPYDQQQEIIAFFLDLTDRKQAEAEREKLLLQAETAREIAEAANRTRDEFLAVLSHELRSPLNPILGWSRLLQTGKLDESRTQQALATIERNAKLQAELIEDLLDISRILQGKLRLTVSSVNLASIIKAAIETVRLAAEAKSIEIEAQLEPEVGPVLGDSTRLQQVVWNLLSNAVKFTPAGGRVRVSLEPVDSQAQIIVSDTGEGISADFLPHVFDYFRQADSATTRKFGGLGLGLAIVHHVVELHGGTICADSLGEGLGATFTVTLPVIPQQKRTRRHLPPAEPLQDLAGVEVLVVDDDADTRDLIQFLLEQEGAQVLIATSAAAALKVLAQSSPDVLLSDVGMPEMNGYMLMQQIRALPPERGGQIKAIALTAYAGDFNRQQALQAGFQQHIAKPVEPESLIQTIVNLLTSDS